MTERCPDQSPKYSRDFGKYCQGTAQTQAVLQDRFVAVLMCQPGSLLIHRYLILAMACQLHVVVIEVLLCSFAGCKVKVEEIETVESNIVHNSKFSVKSRMFSRSIIILIRTRLTCLRVAAVTATCAASGIIETQRDFATVITVGYKAHNSNTHILKTDQKIIPAAKP